MSAGAEKWVWPLLLWCGFKLVWTSEARGLCRRIVGLGRRGRWIMRQKKKAKKRQQGQRRVSVTLGVRRREIAAL